MISAIQPHENGRFGYSPIPFAKRFWSRVDKAGAKNSCWLWKGQKIISGYGAFGRLAPYNNFKTVLAHRLAWQLTNGEIPVGLFVLHKCDQKLCCNPEHLFLGTHKDNMRDMCQKGRHGDTQGSKSGMAKLYEADVRVIRKLARNFELNHIALAHGVAATTICMLVNRKTWRHVR
jgi:hypothetical protein